MSGIATGTTGGRPWFYRNHVSRDIRTITDSSPTQGSQSGTTILASAPFFTPADVGKFVRFSTSEQAQITAFGSSQSVTATPSQTVAQTTFELRGSTLGGTLGVATHCTASGIVVGTEQIQGGGVQHAFWFDSNSGNIRDITVIPGDVTNVPDVSPDGHTLIDTIQGGTAHVGHIYDPVSDTKTPMGLPPLGLQNTPFAITDALIVGCAIDYTVGPNKVNRWQAGVFTDIHPTEAGTNSSQFVAMNSLGHIIGFYFDITTGDESTFINTGGVSSPIGTFGSDCDGTDINDADIVVGTARNGGGLFVPFYWTAAGGIQAIPLLPGTTDGTARAINNLDPPVIVGEMGSTAFLFRNGVTHKLIDLLPAGHGWTALNTARFITDDLFIAGNGTLSATTRGYTCKLCGI